MSASFESKTVPFGEGARKIEVVVVGLGLWGSKIEVGRVIQDVMCF